VSNTNQKKFDYYMGLSYPVTIVKEEVGYSVAILDLPGCLSQGDTLEEALSNIEEAKVRWLEVAMDQGREIPEPDHERAYSGKFLTRVPKGLHKTLVIRAKNAGVSLNQYVTQLLTVGVKEEDYRETTNEVLRALERFKEPWAVRIIAPGKTEGVRLSFKELKEARDLTASIQDNYAYAS